MMPDMEKVINGLELCKQDAKLCFSETECPYQCEFPRCCLKLMADALELLKEREAEGNKWIKCSDEMPEEHETIFAKFKGTEKWSPAMFEKMSEDVRVVVVFEDGTRRVHHSYTVDGKWDIEKKPPKRTVTHWMPNPGLPEEGR